MSEHSYYRAFPETCGLYQRLRRDRPFHILYAHLTLLGPGPFFLSHLEPSDISGTLDWLAEHEPSIGSCANADRLLAELRHEIGETIASHPGIEHRADYLEQVQEELAGLFGRHVQPSAEALLYGKEPLAPGMFDDWRLQLLQVPVVSVCEGAAALQQMTLAILEHPFVKWDLGVENLEWRQAFYLEAARRGDVVVVLTA